MRSSPRRIIGSLRVWTTGRSAAPQRGRPSPASADATAWARARRPPGARVATSCAGASAASGRSARPRRWPTRRRAEASEGRGSGSEGRAGSRSASVGPGPASNAPPAAVARQRSRCGSRRSMVHARATGPWYQGPVDPGPSVPPRTTSAGRRADRGGPGRSGAGLGYWTRWDPSTTMDATGIRHRARGVRPPGRHPRRDPPHHRSGTRHDEPHAPAPRRRAPRGLARARRPRRADGRPRGGSRRAHRRRSPPTPQPTDAAAHGDVLDDGFDGEVVYDPYFISPEPDATPADGARRARSGAARVARR